MIFAELKYEDEYRDVHDQLVSLLSKSFETMESGLQGDSWIWIHVGADKVAIDTFTSMKHQVKSAKPGPHVNKVIDVLKCKYKLKIYENPEIEGHEGI